MNSDIEKILAEVTELLEGIAPEAVDSVAAVAASAGRVYVCGLGRTGLVSGAFAMRLAHLGMRSHVVGEATAPAIGSGDVLVACSGSGRTDVVVAAAGKARSAGARVVAVTGSAETPLGRAADITAVIPFEPHHRPSEGQFGGSAFEQALLIFLDAVVLDLMRRLEQGHEDMGGRHANLP